MEWKERRFVDSLCFDLSLMGSTKEFQGHLCLA